MHIDQEDLRRIAIAARIEISGEEETYLQSLNQAMEELTALTEMDLADTVQTGRIAPQKNVFRKDQVEQVFSEEQNLSSAPDVQDHYFRVPRII